MTSAYAILEPRRTSDPSRRLPSLEPLSWENLYGEPHKTFDDEEDEFGFGSYDYDDEEEDDEDENLEDEDEEDDDD